MTSCAVRAIYAFDVFQFRFVEWHPVAVSDSLVTYDEIVGLRTVPGKNHLAIFFGQFDQGGEVVDVDHRLAGRTVHRLDVHKKVGIAPLDLHSIPHGGAPAGQEGDCDRTSDCDDQNKD